MLKKILTGVLLIFFCSGQAQDLGLELFSGASNYQGDLQEKRYSFQGSKLALGIGASWALTDHFSIRGIFSLARIEANDRNNKDSFLIARNLHFKSTIVEMGFTGQYHIFSTLSARINPYLVAGISVFRHNPYTFDSAGAKHFLKPLSTEGQGLAQYPERKPYGLTQISLPFGAGVKFAVTDRVSIGWEITLRKTFTDYLDDLSRTYVDQATLLAARGPKAVELAYRTGEVKPGAAAYPRDGTIRGGAEFKDWYYFSGVSVTIKMNNPRLSKSAGYTGRPGRTDCPKRVL
jgi:opacity protein-like surface antigen